MISIEKKNQLVNEIFNLLQHLDSFAPDTTSQSLHKFENQLSLNELQECFLTSAPEELEAKLKELLSRRWERIRGSNLCYTQQPFNKVNQLCLNIAKSLSLPVTTPAEIDALEPNTGPYCLLMPSIEKTEDIYGQNIHHLSLQEFVLSDNEQLFIPIFDCMHQASVSDTGQLQHMVSTNDRYPPLTRSEILRVTRHSSQAVSLYMSLVTFNKKRLTGDDIGAQLTQLAAALRSGGAIHGRGEEYNAAAAANLGIVKFSEYWRRLSAEQQTEFFTETPDLRNILGRLFRPADAQFMEVMYCVELTANNIDPVIAHYNRKPSIQGLQQHFQNEENLFRAAVKNQGLAVTSHGPSPKYILPLIFKLDIAQQQNIFDYPFYENALMYVLKEEPQALSQFELTEAEKSTAVSTKFTPMNSSALMRAAGKGAFETVRLLHGWGANITQEDDNGDTALHWAARAGDVATVNYLLEHGASLDGQNFYQRNTALHLAILNKHQESARVLLNHNAGAHLRTSDGSNSLELALTHLPELVEPILMQLVTLPFEQQHMSLRNMADNGHPYSNVLFYAAANYPSLFDALVSKVLEHPDTPMKEALVYKLNDKGENILIKAAQLGKTESVRKLINAGHLTHTADHVGKTALHWAIYHDHADTVACLLKKEAYPNAPDSQNNTPLIYDINARDKEGKNALDLALKSHPRMVEPLLAHLITLPVDQQQKCLPKIEHDVYPNALFFAATRNPILLSNLLLSLSAGEEPAPDARDPLAEMKIYQHIHAIAVHYQKMLQKSQSDLNYVGAVFAAKALLETCIEAMRGFHESEDDADTKMHTFKNLCQDAVETARPVLSQHREWGKMLAGLLLAVLTLPVSLPLYLVGFFSTKTKSEQELDQLQKMLDKPSVPTP